MQQIQHIVVHSTTMNQRLSILFWLRKQKCNRLGQSPIYCRITIDGERSPDFTTNQRITPSEWDSKKQTTTNSSINMILQQMVSDIHLKFIQYVSMNGNISVYELYNIVKCKSIFNPSIVMVCNIYLEHLEKQSESNIIKHISYKKYFGINNSIVQFTSIEKIDNLPAERFGFELVTKLVNYLVNVKKCCTNYCNRFIAYVHNSLRHAHGLGMIKFNPLTGLKLKKTPPKRPLYITHDQIEKIRLHKFVSDRLQNVADMFVWQCLTGQSFADFVNIQSVESWTDQDGVTWLKYNRAKNNEPALVPLCDECKPILMKFKQGFKPLSNQRYNSYLKEIAEIIEIEVNLTTHVGRKSFAHRMLNEKGFSTAVVAKMMGHKKFETTWEHYSRATIDKIKLEMKHMVA